MEQQQILVYGALWCPDCRRAKQFLAQHDIPYQWIDTDENPDATAYVRQVNHGKRIIPTIVFPDGSILVEPSDADLAQKLGISRKSAYRA